MQLFSSYSVVSVSITQHKWNRDIMHAHGTRSTNVGAVRFAARSQNAPEMGIYKAF